MPIQKISSGEAIDKTRINQIIDAVNKLEDAGNSRIIMNRVTSYDTADDKIGILAFQIVSTGWDTTRYWQSGRPISFSAYNKGMAFTQTPILTISSEGTGAYILPYYTSLTASGFNLGALRVSHNMAGKLYSTHYFDCVAVGPVRNI